ncbi:hypothetical protein PISMIDRAFT_677417, partial [Pisolithus microcarpus 441]
LLEATNRRSRFEENLGLDGGWRGPSASERADRCGKEVEQVRPPVKPSAYTSFQKLLHETKRNKQTKELRRSRTRS